jgi:diguanylate cyclase (GGDEF)-like protein
MSLRLGLTLLSLGPLAVACSQAARNELVKRLDHAVNFDFLTDVLARGAFMRKGQRLLERCAQESSFAAVLMMDLDYFKRVNDRWGHATGDLLLREFSHTIGRQLRPQDLFGRVGGEEFAMVLPHVTHTEVCDIAKRLCDATRALVIDAPNGDPVSTTLSIGLQFGSCDTGHMQLENWLLSADAALYQAKAQGRDQFVDASRDDDAQVLDRALHPQAKEAATSALPQPA